MLLAPVGVRPPTPPRQPEIDYFAVSLPDFLVFDDDLQRRNEVHCRYMMALGHVGLGQREEAAEQFQQVRNLDVNHLGAIVHQTIAATLE